MRACDDGERRPLRPMAGLVGPRGVERSRGEVDAVAEGRAQSIDDRGGGHAGARRPTRTPDGDSDEGEGQADPDLTHRPPGDGRGGEDEKLDDGADERVHADDRPRRDEQAPQQDGECGRRDAGEDVPRERPRREAPPREGEDGEQLHEEADDHQRRDARMGRASGGAQGEGGLDAGESGTLRF